MGASKRRTLLVTLVISGVLATGCTKSIDGRAEVAKSTGNADAVACNTVDAPMTTVPVPAGVSVDTEPVVRIPQPDGWTRFTQMDSALIRFAMGNKKLGVPTFAASAAVSMESHPGELDATEFFDESRAALKTTFGSVDVDADADADDTVCGLPAQTWHYTLQMGAMPAVPATVTLVVAHIAGTTYGVALTIQSPKPNDAQYQRDEETILGGFQVLGPG